jgi:hypothetical protein
MAAGIRRTTTTARGLALSSSRLPVAEGGAIDAFRSSVSLLCPFDGANNSTTITDLSPSPVACTANGNAKLSTAQARFGPSSLLLDGTSGCYVSTATSSAFAISSDFSVEFSVYLNTTGESRFTLLHINAGGAQGFHVYHSGTRLLVDNGLAADFDSGSGFLSASAWTDVQLLKRGPTLYILTGGSVINIRNATDYGTPDRCQIGRYSTGGVTDNADCYLDNLRINKGASRLVYPATGFAFPTR